MTGTMYPDFQIAPHCRVKDWTPVPEEIERLVELKAMMEDVCKEYGITPVSPEPYIRAAVAEGQPAKKAKAQVEGSARTDAGVSSIPVD